jgi:hypothetical protein
MSAIVNPPADPLAESLMLDADLFKLLGLASPASPLAEQVVLAGQAVSALIRDYTGRHLTRGIFTDTIRGPHGQATMPTWNPRGRPRAIRLNEWPVVALKVIVSSKGRALDIGSFAVDREHGGLYPRAGAWPFHPDEDLLVTYEAGYQPLPANLRLVMLDLTRRALSAMGVDLAASGGTAVSTAGAAPIKAVTVGSLKVEYAVQAAGAAEVAKAGASPLTADMLEAYAPVLDLYRGVRTLAATIA